MSPDEFMLAHNPMFMSEQDRLQSYATPITRFSEADYQVVCINNSTLGYTSAETNWLGVLHTAVVPTPDESKRRVINSTMLCPGQLAGTKRLDDAAIAEFVQTTTVRRRGYDKQHLEDDS